MGRDARRRRDLHKAGVGAKPPVSALGAFHVALDAEGHRVLFHVPMDAAARQVLRRPQAGLDLWLPAPDAVQVLGWFDKHREVILGWSTAEAATPSAAEPPRGDQRVVDRAPSHRLCDACVTPALPGLTLDASGLPVG